MHCENFRSTQAFLSEVKPCVNLDLANQSTKFKHNGSKIEDHNQNLDSSKEYSDYFNATLSEYRGAIARVVNSYEMITALQQELFQEISVALWKALPNFDKQSSLKTYILSIAHKRAISHVAKYAKEPRTSDISDFEIKGNDCPSENVIKTQRTKKLLLAMSKLSMVERQLVTLALEGVSYKDIAAILGITTNLTGVKLNRAKLKLKKYLMDDVAHG